MKPLRSQIPLIFAGIVMIVACGDPSHDDAVSALGNDPNGIPNGPTHRAGQPCLTCHGGSGPGSPQFVIGGTAYAVKGQTDPLVKGMVHLTDATGATYGIPTNEVGNFYATTGEWSPVAPIHVSLTLADSEADMTTHIGRDGSCADCHTAAIGPRSPGPVYLATDPSDLPGAGSGTGDGGS
ncbi:MAG: hypothetical protein ABI461_01910 [Polyangiaceae bacterium]